MSSVSNSPTTGGYYPPIDGRYPGQSDAPTAPIAAVPPKFFMRVMEYLAPVDLLRCTTVNKCFNKLADDDKLWKRFLPEKTFEQIHQYTINSILIQALINHKQELRQTLIESYKEEIDALVAVAPPAWCQAHRVAPNPEATRTTILSYFDGVLSALNDTTIAETRQNIAQYTPQNKGEEYEMTVMLLALDMAEKWCALYKPQEAADADVAVWRNEVAKKGINKFSVIKGDVYDEEEPFSDFIKVLPPNVQLNITVEDKFDPSITAKFSCMYGLGLTDKTQTTTITLQRFMPTWATAWPIANSEKIGQHRTKHCGTIDYYFKMQAPGTLYLLAPTESALIATIDRYDSQKHAKAVAQVQKLTRTAGQ